MKNPWLGIRQDNTGRYVLSADLAVLERKAACRHVELHEHPAPYVGGLNNAEIILLALNPGFKHGDVERHRAIRGFGAAALRNAQDPYDSTFHILKFPKHGGFNYWAQKLGYVIDAVGLEAVIERTMLIQYFPYHSKDARGVAHGIPSQQFTFDLVRQAMGREKLVVIMRSEREWTAPSAVPTLVGKTYYADNVTVCNSPANPTLTPKNLGDEWFDYLINRLAG